MDKNNCPKDGIKIGGKCISRKVFLDKLKAREKRKVIEILKNDRKSVLEDVDRAIDSGAVDTQEIWESNNYIFPRVVAKLSSGRIAVPDTADTKKLERDLRHII